MTTKTQNPFAQAVQPRWLLYLALFSFFLALVILLAYGLDNFLLLLLVFSIGLLSLLIYVWIKQHKVKPPKLEYNEGELTQELATRLGESDQNAVIWQDGDAEVIVHLDSLRVFVRETTIIAALDLESVETGRDTLVVPFVLGEENDPTNLFTVTESVPRGNPVLAARWGQAVQEALWDAVLGLASDQAAQIEPAPGEAAQVPVAIKTLQGRVLFETGKALTVDDLADNSQQLPFS